MVSHLTERFGLFFIVVLGQSVVAVVAAVAGFQFSFAAWIVAAACFISTLCVWWIYFDLVDTSVVGRGALGLIYLYGHFPLFPGVTAFAAGTQLAITHADQGALDAGARWALAGGIAAYDLALAVLYLGAEWASARDRTLIGRLALATGLIMLAALGAGLSPLAFALLVATAVIAQLLLEAFTFPTEAASILEPPKAGHRTARLTARQHRIMPLGAHRIL